MEENKLITVREAAKELGIDEQEVIDLAEDGKIPAYKIGGVYLRFKPEQVQEAKRRLGKIIKKQSAKISFAERLEDFFYFNDFYILSLLIIIALLIIIFRT